MCIEAPNLEARARVAACSALLASEANGVDRADAHLIRAGAHAALGATANAKLDYEAAIRLYGTLIRPAAPDPALTFRRATAWQALATADPGAVDRAIADYDTTIRFAPRHAAAFLNRGLLLATYKGEQNTALADFDEALAIQPNNPLALFNRGYLQFARRAYGKAIADYSAALKLDPDFALAYNNRCLTRVVAGEPADTARADCAEALKRLPGRPDVHETAGFMHLKLEEPTRALEQYEAALRIAPSRAVALFGRGLAKQRLGDNAGATADLAAARALVPAVASSFSDYGIE